MYCIYFPVFRLATTACRNTVTLDYVTGSFGGRAWRFNNYLLVAPNSAILSDGVASHMNPTQSKHHRPEDQSVFFR